MITWGVVMTLMGIVQSFSGLPLLGFSLESLKYFNSPRVDVSADISGRLASSQGRRIFLRFGIDAMSSNSHGHNSMSVSMSGVFSGLWHRHSAHGRTAGLGGWRW